MTDYTRNDNIFGVAGDSARGKNQSPRKGIINSRSIFWADWSKRAPGEKRSLERAKLTAAKLGILHPRQPVLTVVGSKGKGTAAIYASAYLVAAGLHVVTVTSPGLRGVRDRIRYDGLSVSDAELSSLAQRISTAHAALPTYQTGTGYLSPSGLFIIAGVLYAKDMQVDVIVLEAGMGGVSDEVSIFSPTILAITEIFGEHLGVLGDTPAEIARDKAGVTTPATSAVVSLPQETSVKEALTETVAVRSKGRIRVEFTEDETCEIPASMLAPSLGRQNSAIGCVAAQRLLSVENYGAPSTERLSKVLSSVVLPGRWSWHDVPGTPARLFADAAISRVGVAAALTEAYRHWDRIDHVLICMPDHKDIAGAIVELGDLPVTYVRLTDKPRLTFTHELPPGWIAVDMDDVSLKFLAACGERIVALGTGYFIARILDLVNADTERLFAPSPD